MTVRADVAHHCGAYPRWRWERAQALSAQMDCFGIAHCRAFWGDQQKLAVVLALAHDPDVLLLTSPWQPGPVVATPVHACVVRA